jgi:hypothetical protein
MKLYKQIIFILIVFLKTETLLSENNIFNVNNIMLEKKDKISNNVLANQAIKKGFNQLITKILLEEDQNKLIGTDFSKIKQLVTFYQITNISDEKKLQELVNFSVTFDKDKIHDLFYSKGISYSEITDKELFILPIYITKEQIFIFNNNFYYENWNKIFESDLIEFNLVLENIEIIQDINQNKNNLINLQIEKLFQEYSNKNLALIIIEENKANTQKVYIKSIIQGKKISKSLNLKKKELENKSFEEKIITATKKELINLVKSENLIDIRTPSFLNVKFIVNKSSNLVDLNLRIKNIDLIEKVYVQEFNKDFMYLRIKYLGKLEKIIRQLNQENINLNLINDEWVIKTF